MVPIQLKVLDGRSLSPLFAIGRFNRAEIFALAADDEDAPASELNLFVGGGLGLGPGPAPVPGELIVFWPVLPGG